MGVAMKLRLFLLLAICSYSSSFAADMVGLANKNVAMPEKPKAGMGSMMGKETIMRNGGQCKSPFERSIDALKPSPELEKKLRAVVSEDSQKKDADLRDTVRTTKRAMFDGFKNEAKAEAEIRKLYQSYTVATKELEESRLNTNIKIWNLLNTKQREIWFTYKRCMRQMPKDNNKPPMQHDDQPDVNQ